MQWRRSALAQQRVADRGGSIDRLLVAEPPRPCAAGDVAGLAGVALVMIASAALGKLGEDLAQRCLA